MPVAFAVLNKAVVVNDCKIAISNCFVVVCGFGNLCLNGVCACFGRNKLAEFLAAFFGIGKGYVAFAQIAFNNGLICLGGHFLFEEAAPNICGSVSDGYRAAAEIARYNGGVSLFAIGPALKRNRRLNISLCYRKLPA